MNNIYQKKSIRITFFVISDHIFYHLRKTNCSNVKTK